MYLATDLCTLAILTPEQGSLLPVIKPDLRKIYLLAR